MVGFDSPSDHEPLTWFRRVPVYVTTVLVALFVVSMFVSVFADSARLPTLSTIGFEAGSFWREKKLWQVITYPLYQLPSFFFAIGMFFLYRIGTDLERFIGRSRFLQLLAIQWFLPPTLLTLWWIVGRPQDYHYSGSYELMIGLFIALATLYPNAEIFGWVTMKWLAFASLLLASLNYLPTRNWPGLSVVLGAGAAGFGYIRWLQNNSPLPDVRAFFGRVFRRRPKFTVVRPEPIRPQMRKTAVSTPEVDDIDPLLDKIAKSGINSLTAAERARLEKARAALLKRDPGAH